MPIPCLAVEEKNMEVEMFFRGKWISTNTTVSSPAICISSTVSSRTISFNSYDFRSNSDLYGKFSGQIRLERYCRERSVDFVLAIFH